MQKPQRQPWKHRQPEMKTTPKKENNQSERTTTLSIIITPITMQAACTFFFFLQKGSIYMYIYILCTSIIVTNTCRNSQYNPNFPQNHQHDHQCIRNLKKNEKNEQGWLHLHLWWTPHSTVVIIININTKHPYLFWTHCCYQTTTVTEFPRLALANNLKFNHTEQMSIYYEPPTNIHNKSVYAKSSTYTCMHVHII